MDELWGAIRAGEAADGKPLLLPESSGRVPASSRRGSAPKGCVWVAMFELALLWIIAFTTRQRGAVCRRWTLDAYLGKCPVVEIVLDASPFGMGAYLKFAGVARFWFAVNLTAFDHQFFGWARGDPGGQQTWEALVLLVAVRHWIEHILHVRAKLRIRGDNMSALEMISTLKSRGAGQARIARELALDLADGTWVPDVLNHEPGVSNTTADVLSRKFQEGKVFAVPACLSGATETHPPARDKAFFRSLNTPQ